MSKLFLYKIIPAIILLLFIVIMNSGTYLMHPWGFSDNVPGYFPQIYNNISRNQWNQASYDLENLHLAWRRVIKRIQFSVERDEINNFQHSMARLKGFLEARNQPGAYAEIEEMKETWDDLGQ